MFQRPARFVTVVLAVVMAAGLTAPGALADHNNELKKDGSNGNPNVDGPHEFAPNPPVPLTAKAECVFQGLVSQAKAKDPQVPVHNHVTLSELTLDCRDLRPGEQHFNTTFEVEANAGTDGQANPLESDDKDKVVKSDTHGATAVQGWSHSNGYSCGSAWEGFAQNTNKGDISATRVGGTQHTLTVAEGACTNPWSQSWFKFVQGWELNAPAAPNVYAWGQLAWSDDKGKQVTNGKTLPNCFVAPTVGAVPTPGGVVIFGTAFIFDAYQYRDMKDPLIVPSKADMNDACDFQKKQTYSSPSPGNSGGNGGGNGGARGPKG